MDKRKVTSPEMLAEILKHEQGHYIIAYMEQQELIRTVSKNLCLQRLSIHSQQIFSTALMPNTNS